MTNSKNFSRRKFISTVSGGSLAVSIAAAIPADGYASPADASLPNTNPDIIDTNINLFKWPFRQIKYGDTRLLVAKLRNHRITKAWAGNFEALFSKNIDDVNARLVKECHVSGEGILLPFGTVNPAWPDWEEDLRRCHEEYKMQGIRLYPAYQTFRIDDIEFTRLISMASERELIIQIVADMEDSRVQHPIVLTREVNFEPLPDIMKKFPRAKVQLLNWNQAVNNKLRKKLVDETNIVFDISRIESTGGLGRMIDGNSWYGPQAPVPVERFLFGSHAPFFPLEASIIKLFESPLTREQMQAIMNGNARKLNKHT